jgi:hypothetical protein
MELLPLPTPWAPDGHARAPSGGHSQATHCPTHSPASQRARKAAERGTTTAQDPVVLNQDIQTTFKPSTAFLFVTCHVIAKAISPSTILFVLRRGLCACVCGRSGLQTSSGSRYVAKGFHASRAATRAAAYTSQQACRLGPRASEVPLPQQNKRLVQRPHPPTCLPLVKQRAR